MSGSRSAASRSDVHGTFLIEVRYRPGARDPLAEALSHDLRHLGYKGLRKVATSQLYRMIGGLSAAERRRVAEDLLTDPVTQQYHDGGWDPARNAAKVQAGGAIVVDVWYKPGVTDAVGESVLKGICDLGLTGVTEVRAGMRYRFWGLGSAETARRVGLSLLANPLVHEQSIHVD